MEKLNHEEFEVSEADSTLMHAVLEWIEMILDGEEVSDFALSFFYC
jgi:hypothetical protein